MSFNIITNPLRKEIHQFSSYQKLLKIDEARMKKIEGEDVEWLIDKRQTSSDKPVIPDNEVYLSLQNENELLWKTMELINTGWLQNKLWLDSIETEEEAEWAIISLIEHVILYWRTYLESDDPDIFYKMPVLGSRFSIHENRLKAFGLITLMERVLWKRITIEKLLTEWHGGKTWDAYDKKYDFDDSLWALIQVQDLKIKYHNNKQGLFSPKN